MSPGPSHISSDAASAANIDAASPAGSTYSVSPPMRVVSGQQLLEFRAGVVYSLSPAVLARCLCRSARLALRREGREAKMQAVAA
jgi:hypothetical protein